MNITKYSLLLLTLGLWAGAAGHKVAAQTVIADGSRITLESVVDEFGGFPSFESQWLRLTLVRPQASGLELLPFGQGGIGLYTLFNDGTRRVSVDWRLHASPWVDVLPEERLAALTLTPWSEDLSSSLWLQWGDDRLPGGTKTYARLDLPDERAPATLDYAGTFSGEDPHEAAVIGPRFNQRDESSLAEFRRLAGLPPDFAPWTTSTNLDPKFFVAQADGLIVAAPSPISDYGRQLFGGPPPQRYRRDGTEDTSFMPPGGSGILGQLPDGRILGTLVRSDDSNLPAKLIAYVGTNIAQAELLAFMGPWYYAAYRGQSEVVQFAIINQDGSMLLDQGVRPRGCGKADHAEIVGLPSLNGERLRGTRARLFWKSLVPTRFAFRQLRRSRAVRESAGSVIVEVRRLGDLSKGQTVRVATADGSANAGRDYQATSEGLSFEQGQVSRSIRIPLIGGGTGGGRKTFFVAMEENKPSLNTSPEMIATPRHVVTIQGDVRLEWTTPNRVRVWNPPFQFTVRAFGSLAEAVSRRPPKPGSPETSEVFSVSANQYSPATDYFDLDLAALPTQKFEFGWSVSAWQPFNATREQFFSQTGGQAVFLRIEGGDDDTEETNGYCD